MDSGERRALPDFSRREQGEHHIRLPDTARQPEHFPTVPSLSIRVSRCPELSDAGKGIGHGIDPRPCPPRSPVIYAGGSPQGQEPLRFMTRLHLHLLSDSTGETLEMMAKAALAQFDDAEVVRHFWPMVRSRQHLERIMGDIAANPGLVIFTLVNLDIREQLENRCGVLGLPIVSALDAVIAALQNQLGQEAKGRPGRQHLMNEAYFERVGAIHYTIAHDDGVGWDDWEDADIVLAGVSRTSKTPTSIYLANRGYKVANVPLVIESPPPPALFSLRRPLVVGLVTAPERLVQVRRNRLLSLNESPETDYVDKDAVERELKFARRMFADNGWPVIDVTRRSIEETAGAILRLLGERDMSKPVTGAKPI